jgi:hypothetical protein
MRIRLFLHHSFRSELYGKAGAGFNRHRYEADPAPPK